MPAPDVVSIVGEIASFLAMTIARAMTKAKGEIASFLTMTKKRAMTKAEEGIASFLAMTNERAMTLVGYNGVGMDVPS